MRNGYLCHHFTHLQLSDGDCELKSLSQGHTAIRADLVGEPSSIWRQRSWRLWYMAWTRAWAPGTRMPPTNYMPFGQVISIYRFPHLWNGVNNGTHLRELFWRANSVAGCMWRGLLRPWQSWYFGFKERSHMPFICEPKQHTNLV